MNSLTVTSPAKINLYLKVLGRRPDGYHDLLTVFHRISLSDTLILEKAKSFSLKCPDPNLPTGKENLITKAYRLAKWKIPSLGGVKVFLEKKIPVGAGLGGGSGNAAAFLLGLKKLYRLEIPARKNLNARSNSLLAWGRELGADVPFFLSQVNQAVGIGRGDEIFPRPLNVKYWFVLALSAEGLSTFQVYQNLPKRLPAVSLTKGSGAVTILCANLEGKKRHRAARLFENDLEQPAFQLRPSLRKIIADFEKQGVIARMSGSGPSVFAILSSFEEAKRLAQKLQQEMPSQKIVICHTV